MTGPTYHARTHLPGGTDPLNAILYDYYNEGGFLDVITDNYLSFVNNGDGGTVITDTGALGIGINSSDHIAIINTGGTDGINIQQIGGSGGIALSDTSSSGIFLAATNEMQLSSGGGMTLTDAAGGIHLNATNSPTDFSSVGANAVGILAGGAAQQGVIELATFDVNLHKNYLWFGSVLFPGSGLTFHGVTAQITHSTQTFTVVDAGGFPILRVDEGGSVHIRAANPTLVADL